MNQFHDPGTGTVTGNLTGSIARAGFDYRF
jgi:hypothetical protein